MGTMPIWASRRRRRPGSHSVLLSCIIAVICCAGVARALSGLRMLLPTAVQTGATVSLSCNYTLNPGESLYSIKWYRNEVEFYRFVPKEKPETKVFVIEGVDRVDLDNSNNRVVTLYNVTRGMSGFYKCEVSGDEPHFETQIQTEYLTVFEPPSRKPEISAVKMPGGIVQANCTTAGTPAPNITWLIDGNPFNDTSISIRYFNVSEQPSSASASASASASPMVAHAGSLGPLLVATPRIDERTKEWVTSSVRVRVVGQDGTSRRSLSCLASIYEVWKKKSDEVPLKEDQPQPQSVRGPATGSGVRQLANLTVLCVVLLARILLGLDR